MADIDPPILDALTEHLESQDALHLMKLLPKERALKWRSQHGIGLGRALVIGHMHDVEIIAGLVQNGDKPREVRYYLNPKKGDLKCITADEIHDADLLEPFVYISGTSKSEKRRVSIFIKYFFLKTGVINDHVGGDLREFCKRFHGSLQTIAIAKAADGVDIHALRDDVEDEEADSTEVPVTSEFDSDIDPKSDYATLLRYLDGLEMLFLLENIPKHDQMRFEKQDLLPEARPMKLHVGNHKRSGHDIWAFMRKARTVHHHEIVFYVQAPRESAEKIPSVNLGNHPLVHPFDKTFSSHSKLNQTEAARLTMTCKWYFISSGVAKNVVLKETLNYPYRFRSGLEFINQKISGTSVSGVGISNSTDDENEQEALEDTVDGPHNGKAEKLKESIDRSDNKTDKSVDIDEDQIQSALGEDVSFTSSVTTGTNAQLSNSGTSITNSTSTAATTTTGGPSQQQSRSPTSHSSVSQVQSQSQSDSRLRKRKASDAGLDEFRGLLDKDNELTEEINELDADLDELEAQRIAKVQRLDRLKELRRQNLDKFRRASAKFAQVAGLD